MNLRRQLPIIAPTGPVLQNTAGATLLKVNAAGALVDGSGDPLGAGGSVTSAAILAAGSPVVYKIPFAFDTPNLSTGAAMYTPTIGDLLLDAWIEIDTYWDGQSPKGDVGSFAGLPTGFFFSTGNGCVDMTIPDDESSGGGVLINPSIGCLLGLSYSKRVVPAKFSSADPIQICVSADGSNVPVSSTLGAPAPATVPFTVVANTNDYFIFNGATYAVSPGVYATADDLAAAMTAAVNVSAPFNALSDFMVVSNVLGTFLATGLVQFGGKFNGAGFVEVNGFFAATGFDSTRFAGGAGGDPGATQGSAILYLVIASPVTP